MNRDMMKKKESSETSSSGASLIFTRSTLSTTEESKQGPRGPPMFTNTKKTTADSNNEGFGFRKTASVTIPASTSTPASAKPLDKKDQPAEGILTRNSSNPTTKLVVNSKTE